MFYSIGNKCIYVLYDDIYTEEETIRHDIVFTMWREGGWDEMKLGAPAWGISTDERISSMTINEDTKLYEQGGIVWGQDFSERMIALVKKKMPEAKLYQGDFSNVLVEELKQNRYDAIFYKFF